jgi:hypothetical protein
MQKERTAEMKEIGKRYLELDVDVKGHATLWVYEMISEMKCKVLEEVELDELEFRNLQRQMDRIKEYYKKEHVYVNTD